MPEGMNIWSPKGTKVVFSGTGGWPAENAIANKRLTIGQEYTIESTRVSDWSTAVFLQEHPGICFNSVMFNVPEPEKPEVKMCCAPTQIELSSKERHVVLILRVGELKSICRDYYSLTQDDETNLIAIASKQITLIQEALDGFTVAFKAEQDAKK